MHCLVPLLGGGGEEGAAVVRPLRFSPFAWSTTQLESVPDFRPIDTFDFEPVDVKWTLAATPALGSDER